jgi:hypothetical protein
MLAGLAPRQGRQRLGELQTLEKSYDIDASRSRGANLDFSDNELPQRSLDQCPLAKRKVVLRWGVINRRAIAHRGIAQYGLDEGHSSLPGK